MIFIEKLWLTSYILFTQNIEMSSCRDHTSYQGHVSRKSRELFGPEKPFVKLRPAYSVKLIFSHVVKGIKIKITAKFRASRSLRFEDTKRICHPKYTRKFPGLSRNRPQISLPSLKTQAFCFCKENEILPKNEVFYNFAAICFGVLISFALKYSHFQCKITLTPALTT